jgi:hypothetical protein
MEVIRGPAASSAVVRVRLKAPSSVTGASHIGEPAAPAPAAAHAPTSVAAAPTSRARRRHKVIVDVLPATRAGRAREVQDWGPVAGLRSISELLKVQHQVVKLAEWSFCCASR